MSEPKPDPATPTPSADGGNAAQAQRVHILEVAADNREKVLSSFTDQRAAIVKAVDDQREAAMAPIDAVRARLGRGPLRPRPQPPAAGGGAVATEIVTILKALIAEEVRAQLQSLLASAAAASPAPDAAGKIQPDGAVTHN